MRVRGFLGLLLVFAALLSASAFAQADIAVTKTGPVSAAAGTDVPYDVSVVNIGPMTSGTVTLTDPIPAGMTFTSLMQNSGPAFNCAPLPPVGMNGTITCTIASLNVNQSADFTITLHIDPATPAGTTFTNIATVSSSNDPNSENDSSAAATTTPSNNADVGITKIGPTSAGPNTNVTYTITVQNSGPSAAQNVTWTDTLPGTMTFVSLNQNSGPTFTCTTGATISCSLATMNSGASASFTLVGHIPIGTASGTTYMNTANITANNPDPNPDNNSSSTLTTVSSADVGVTKSGPLTVTAGQNIQYTITFTNNGPDPATSPGFLDNLPSQTTFVSIVETTATGATCNSPTTTSAGCSWPSLNNGVTATFTLTAFVPASVPGGTVLTNNITASTASFDPNSANNTFSTNTTVIGVTDVAVMKTAPASAAAGSNISYTITVSNNGASPASTVQLTDALPAGTTFVSLGQSGPAFICTTPGVGANGTVMCNIASLAPGASTVFTLVVQTAGNASGTISNTANVTTTTTDTNPANNSSTASTNVTLQADIAVMKSGAPPTVAAGSNITWTITVSNIGASAASTVQLTDVLAPQTTFVSLGQSGPAFSCTTPAVGAGGTVTCNIATLNSGASTTFTLVVQTTIAAGGTVSNTASATTTTPEATLTNNSATASVTVTPSPLVPALSGWLLMMLAAVLAGIALMTRPG